MCHVVSAHENETPFGYREHEASNRQASAVSDPSLVSIGPNDAIHTKRQSSVTVMQDSVPYPFDR